MPSSFRETFERRAPTLDRFVKRTKEAGLRFEAWLAKDSNFVRAGMAFVLCVGVAHLIPVLNMFCVCPWGLLAVKTVENSPWGVGKPPLVHWHNILSYRSAVLIDILEWCVATAAFAYLARKANVLALAFLAPLGILVVIILVQLGVRVCGMNFYWDLWH